MDEQMRREIANAKDRAVSVRNRLMQFMADHAMLTTADEDGILAEAERTLHSFALRMQARQGGAE
jgi:hypothetical protein